ncbi:MAG: hypothetical protein M1812_002968 [Candelaria pacifica]|nr:MAG: hypothetical protein M1812_002968 [Candelaria pacifica]
MSFNTSVPPFPLSPGKLTLYEGRVSKIAFEAIIGVFFGLAITTAIIRLILQMRFHRRLYPDDYLLIFACVSLTASTALGYVKVDVLYWSQELHYNPQLLPYYIKENVDIAAHINTYIKLKYTCPTLLWTTIFAIKFAYLAFFRRLTEQVRPLIVYWRVVVSLTVVSFPICILSIHVVIVCMKWGLEAAVCSQPIYFHRTLIVAILDIVLDVSTDLLIVAISLHILWTVRISPSQKFVLGIFLSLNLIMAITASVRISSLRYLGTIDEVWLFLWLQLEACVAIAMLSLTAFRSAFVVSSRARRENHPKEAWYSSVVEAVKRRAKVRRIHDREESDRGLPKIPSATMTGLRSFIRGGCRTDADILSENRTSMSEWGEGKNL